MLDVVVDARRAVCAQGIADEAGNVETSQNFLPKCHLGPFKRHSGHTSLIPTFARTA